MIKALIVDDEQTAIDMLTWLLEQFCPEVTAIRASINVNDAIRIISDFQPDILFLDIRMPHQGGFDLLLQVKNWSFEVIFTTAYNEYAIKAIRFSALDYLLKPIDTDELVKALQRFKAKRIFAPAGRDLFQNFIQNIASTDKMNYKLALPSAGEIKYLDVRKIIRAEGERNYTRFYLEKKQTFVTSKTLREYENLLKEHGFVRVHKSHLVNLAYVEKYDREGWLQMENGQKIDVSRRKKEYLLQRLKGEKL